MYAEVLSIICLRILYVLQKIYVLGLVHCSCTETATVQEQLIVHCLLSKCS